VAVFTKLPSDPIDRHQWCLGTIQNLPINRWTADQVIFVYFDSGLDSGMLRLTETSPAELERFYQITKAFEAASGVEVPSLFQRILFTSFREWVSQYTKAEFIQHYLLAEAKMEGDLFPVAFHNSDNATDFLNAVFSKYSFDLSDQHDPDF